MHNQKLPEELPEDSAGTTREREPDMCRLELMQVVMQGAYPSEQRIEYMLDKIEARS